jgi:Na+/pantothenate symporter
LSQAGVAWQGKLAIILLPAAAVVVMCLGMKFPPTERAASGVSMGEMFRELLNPMFLVLFCSMFLTAASELAPGQWVDLALTRTVHMQGILLLVYVSGIMFVARHLPGPGAQASPPRAALEIAPALLSPRPGSAELRPIPL